MLAPACEEGAQGLAPGRHRLREGSQGPVSEAGGQACADLQQHMADLHGALLGSRVQGRALALLVTLEVGVQIVHCRENPPHRERGTGGKLARGQVAFLQEGFMGVPTRIMSFLAFSLSAALSEQGAGTFSCA